MRDETYLYEDTILNAVNALMEQEWQYNDAEEAIRILQACGLVIRERHPRKEDIAKGVSVSGVQNPTLTGGFTGGGRVGPLYYEYTPAVSIDGRDIADYTRVNQTAKITDEEKK